MSGSEIWLIERSKLAIVTGVFASLSLNLRRERQNLLVSWRGITATLRATQPSVISTGFFTVYACRDGDPQCERSHDVTPPISRPGLRRPARQTQETHATRGPTPQGITGTNAASHQTISTPKPSLAIDRCFQ
jgi:hypothetical protein